MSPVQVQAKSESYSLLIQSGVSEENALKLLQGIQLDPHAMSIMDIATFTASLYAPKETLLDLCQALSRTGVVPHGRETEEQQRAFRS